MKLQTTTTLFLIITLIALTLASDCPHYSQVSTCTPKCKTDIECASNGGKCCSNICNTKSCVSRQNNSKYGSNSDTSDKCELEIFNIFFVDILINFEYKIGIFDRISLICPIFLKRFFKLFALFSLSQKFFKI